MRFGFMPENYFQLEAPNWFQPGAKPHTVVAFWKCGIPILILRPKDLLRTFCPAELSGFWTALLKISLSRKMAIPLPHIVTRSQKSQIFWQVLATFCKRDAMINLNSML